MTVRPATEADVPAIRGLWNGLIRETLVTFNSVEKSEADVAAYLAARAAEGQAFFVAEVDGEVLGFATYFQFRGGVGYRHTLEHSIMLDPRARGRGLGRGLMAAVEDHARAAGHHSLFAGVSGANPEGRAFHAAIGFRDVATLREVGFKNGQWLDLWLMQKML